MTTIEKMDMALDTMYRYKHKRIAIDKFIKEIYFPLTIVEVSGSVEILKQDGYIREFVDERVRDTLLKNLSVEECHNHYTFLVITMNGMLFKESGGYKWKYRKEKVATNLQVLQNCAITIGTIAGGAYALKEIVVSEIYRNILLSITVSSLAVALILILIPLKYK